MKQYIGLTGNHPGDSWVTIGSFDGVHRGHQQLITSMVAEAHKAKANAVVLTFFPHPVVILRNISDPIYLSTVEERVEMLDALGVDAVITLEFTRELAGLTGAEFMQRLMKAVKLRALWVGPGFALGKGRGGDIEFLHHYGQSYGYKVQIVDPYRENGLTVSSSIIRAALQEGEVEAAHNWLGRPYSVSGIVTHGDARGRELGFPTANISTHPQRLLPKIGVYACRVKVENDTHLAVTNIGLRPTFGDGQLLPTLETHLLDYSGDLYGKKISVEFLERLRDEKKFAGIEELIHQINTDIAHTREAVYE